MIKISKVEKKIYFTLFKNFNKYFDQKYLLIHFPKTAGTLIKNEIENKKLFNKIIYFDHEENFSRLQKKFPKNKYVIFIRNPITWYISYYHNKIKSSHKHKLYNKNSFADFMNDLVINQSVSSIRRWHIPNKKNTIMDMVAELNNIDLGFFSKVFFMYSFKEPIFNLKNLKTSTDKKLIKQMMGVDKVFKFENLEEFNLHIFKQSHHKVNFNKFQNKGPDIDISEYYDSELMDKVLEKDKLIFDLFY